MRQALRALLSLSLFSSISLPVSLGCALAPRPSQLVDDEHGSVVPSDATPGAPGPVCADGDRKSCKVSLGSHDGVTSCFVGERVCSGGLWLGCGDPGPTTLSSDVTVVATCPVSTTPRWRHLAYAIDAPSNASGSSRVTIAAQAAVDAAPREFLPATPVTLVDVPRDPLACNADDAACAHDIAALLGEALGSRTTLRLHVTRMQTPDARATPDVAFITPVYDCVASL